MSEIQQPDVLGNYLAGYGAGRQINQQRDTDQRNAMLRQYAPQALQGDANALTQVAGADPEAAMKIQSHLATMSTQKLQQLKNTWDVGGALLQNIRPGDEAGVEAVKKQLFSLGVNPQDLNGLNSQNAAQWAALSPTVQGHIDDILKRKALNANINQSNAAADASRASADRSRNGGKAPPGYTWSPDGSTLVALPGGPSDPARKLTEGQSKDLGYYQRGTQANKRLTSDRIDQMTNGWNSSVGDLPVIGNASLTPAARQGRQAAADFIAVILRKDTGAAVTPQEFQFYSRIFIPEYGDDAVTKRQKAQSREQALASIKNGMGAAQILTEMGVAPPVGGDIPSPPPPTQSPQANGLPPGFRIVP